MANFQFITELNTRVPLACVHTPMPGQVREKAPLQDKAVQCTHSACIILSSLDKIQQGSYIHSHPTDEELGIRGVNKWLAHAGTARKWQEQNSNWGLKTPKLILFFFFFLNQAASRVKLPSTHTIVAMRFYHLFITINQYVSGTHHLYGTALVSTATHCQSVMGVSRVQKNDAVMACDRGSEM